MSLDDVVEVVSLALSLAIGALALMWLAPALPALGVPARPIGYGDAFAVVAMGRVVTQTLTAPLKRGS